MDGESVDKILMDETNFHVKWLVKTVERIRERRANGERDMMISIDQMEYMLCETIGLHQRLTMMEQYLANMANYASGRILDSKFYIGEKK